MNQPLFDPDTFLQTETTQVGETDFTPIPEDEYLGVIKSLKAGVTANNNAKLDINWMIDDERVKEFTGMDEPTAKQTVWLDLDANGNLEFGANKNIGLNKVRDALGQNDGSPWNPNMMQGQVARVLVKHSAPNEAGSVYANVVQVAPA